MDPDRPRARAIGVWRGLVLGVDEELPSGVEANERIDAQGATIVPGFNDVHAHTVWFGLSKLEIDLSGCTDVDQLIQTIRRGAADLPPEEWAVASNFQPTDVRGEVTRAVLDEAAEGRPLLVRHCSGHAISVNAAALAASGVDEQTPDPEGGHIDLDTGVMEENAMRLIRFHSEPDPEDRIVEAIEIAHRHYAKEGITSVTDAGIAGGWIGHSPREFGAYQRAWKLARTQTMVTLDALHPLGGHEREPEVVGLDAGIRTGVGDEWLQIGPAKIFTDGSLLGFTAAMSEDYCGCSGVKGYLQQDPDELKRKALQAAKGGWALALHAIGDAAVDLAIDVLQDAPASSMPHRIEHGGVVREDQVQRLAEMGVVVVPQPRFVGVMGDKLAERLGPERANLSYPAGRLLRAGMILPGSSDRPVADGDPLHGMQAFVERLTESGKDFGLADRISPEDALHAYTVGSAAATGWGGRKEQIRAGQFADFAVLGGDPLTVGFDGVAVEATMAGGAWTYGQEKFASSNG